MNKEFVLTAGLLSCLLASAGCDGDRSNNPKGPTLRSPAGVEYLVSEGNAEQVARYQSRREAAQAYVSKVISRVDELLAMKELPRGDARLAQTRSMLSLKQEGDLFGAFIGADAAYLHHCRASGSAANAMWEIMSGLVLDEPPETALERVNDEVSDCLEQIQTPPEVTVKLVGPKEVKEPPFDNCLETLVLGEKEPAFSQWICPVAATRF